jgi:hypothetical protein
MSLTDLGIMQQSATLLGPATIFKYGTENVYSIWMFWYTNYNTIKTNIISLNHDTDAVVISEGAYGRPAANIFLHPTNGLSYFSTGGGGGAVAKLISLNHITGQVIALTDLPTYTGYVAYDTPQSTDYSDEAHYFGGRSLIQEHLLFSMVSVLCLLTDMFGSTLETMLLNLIRLMGQ